MKDDRDDELAEEAEAREFYGDAYPEPVTSDECQVTSAKPSSPPYEGGVDAASADGVVLCPPTAHTASGPNYHYLKELTDDHLPDLDYHRIDNLFLARPASGWHTTDKTNNIQRPLFGEFWNEGELAILFADTGKGKSILAVQIAESIASGTAIKPFKLGTKPQRVLLFDFELDDRQFSLRYSAAAGKRKREYYKFSDNFIRAKIGDVEDLPPEFKSYNEFLTWSLIELVEFTRGSVVIIDNITWLNASTQNPVAALRLMKTLKRLKQDRGLSILVLAHTPKRYNTSPLTINDLQGSKMLANFADNIFALGDSKISNDLRYLKHLKLRNAEIQHDARNVITLRLNKMQNAQCTVQNSKSGSPTYEGGVAAAAADGVVLSDKGNNSPNSQFSPLTSQLKTFLGFTVEGFCAERDHIGWQGSQYDPERHALTKQAQRLSSQGLSQRDIADALGMSPSTICRYLKVDAERRPN